MPESTEDLIQELSDLLQEATIIKETRGFRQQTQYALEVIYPRMKVIRQMYPNIETDDNFPELKEKFGLVSRIGIRLLGPHS